MPFPVETKPSIIGLCDFKPQNSNGSVSVFDVLNFRQVMRQLSFVALNEDMARIRGSQTFSDNLNAAKATFGENLDGRGGVIKSDIEEIEKIVLLFEKLAHTLDFSHAIGDADTLLKDEYTKAVNRLNIEAKNKLLYELVALSSEETSFSSILAKALSDLGFEKDNVIQFSSTKVALHLFELLGLLLSRPISSVSFRNARRAQDKSGYKIISLNDAAFDPVASLVENPPPELGSADTTNDQRQLVRVDWVDKKPRPAEVEIHSALKLGSLSIGDLAIYLAREVAKSSMVSSYEGDASSLGGATSEREAYLIAAGIDLGIGQTGSSNLTKLNRNLSNVVSFQNDIDNITIARPNKRTIGTTALPINIRTNLFGAVADSSIASSMRYDVDESAYPGNQTFISQNKLLLEQLAPQKNSGIRDYFFNALQVKELPLLAQNRQPISISTGAGSQRNSRIGHAISHFSDRVDEYALYAENMSGFGYETQMPNSLRYTITGLLSILFTSSGYEALIKEMSLTISDNILIDDQRNVTGLDLLRAKDQGGTYVTIPAAQFDSANFSIKKTAHLLSHAYLFMQNDARFLFALEAYAWNFFIKKHYDNLRPALKSFVASGLVPTRLSEVKASLDTNVVVGSTVWDGKTDGKLPALLVYALIRYGNSKAQDDSTIAQGNSTRIIDVTAGLDIDADSTRVEFTPARLLMSLNYDTVQQVQGDLSPFSVLSKMFLALLTAASDQSESSPSSPNPLTIEKDRWFRNSVASSEDNALNRIRTSASGMTARGMFSICFTMFRKALTTSSEKEKFATLQRPYYVFSSGDKVDKGHIDTTATSNSFDPIRQSIATDTGTDLAAGIDNRDKILFVIKVPRYNNVGSAPRVLDFNLLKSDVDLTGSGLENSGLFAALYGISAGDLSAAQQEYRKNNSALLRVICLLQSISRSAKLSLNSISNALTVASSPLLDSTFRTNDQFSRQVGAEIIANITPSRLITIQKHLQSSLTFLKPDRLQSNLFLPAMDDPFSDPYAAKQTGRLAALKCLLSEVGFNPSSGEDPSNARILVVGVPDGAMLDLQRPTLDGRLLSVNAGQPWENTLYSLNVTKKDAQLPTVAFEKKRYLFDSALYIPHDGYDLISYEPGMTLSNQLTKIKFRKTNNDVKGSSTYFVRFTENGFQTNADNLSDELESLSVEESREVALNVVISDLLKVYTSMVLGLEISESAFVTRDFRRLDVDRIALPSNISGMLEQQAVSINQFSRPLSFVNFEPGAMNKSDYTLARQLGKSLIHRARAERLLSLVGKRFTSLMMLLIDPDTFMVKDYGSDANVVAAQGTEQSLIKDGLTKLGFVSSDASQNDFIVKSSTNLPNPTVYVYTAELEKVDVERRSLAGRGVVIETPEERNRIIEDIENQSTQLRGLV